VPIYSIGLMQMQREMADANMSGSQRMDFLQRTTNCATFAKETGGAAYSPRGFRGEYGQIFPNVLHQSLRNQYATHVPAQQYQAARWRVPQDQSGAG